MEGWWQQLNSLIYDHRNGIKVVPSQVVKDIQDVLSSISPELEKNTVKNLKNDIWNKMVINGWSGEYRLDSDSQITIYNRSTNQVISDVIKAKNAYVEYDFSKFTNIALFFMKQQGVSAEYTDYIIEQIQNSISYIYYKNEPLKRVLKESGIYEKDIDVVAAYAKDCGEDVNLIRTALKENYVAYKDKVSFLTRYSINRM